MLLRQLSMLLFELFVLLSLFFSLFLKSRIFVFYFQIVLDCFGLLVMVFFELLCLFFSFFNLPTELSNCFFLFFDCDFQLFLLSFSVFLIFYDCLFVLFTKFVEFMFKLLQLLRLSSDIVLHPVDCCPQSCVFHHYLLLLLFMLILVHFDLIECCLE